MRLTVVIPVLNESRQIDAAIASCRAAGAAEVIVVDGGSTDDTVPRAQQADTLLTGSRGRAVQMNAGAAAATGDVLLFLHADCRLPPGAATAVDRALAGSRTVGGCFRQRIDAAGLSYRLVEAGNALRVRLLNWAYGDQAIFVRRAVFEQLGGFPPLRLMEDLYFMKQLKRAGRVALLNERLVVSARRWQQQGVLRQTLRNWSLVLGAALGRHPDSLARAYPDVREPETPAQ